MPNEVVVSPQPPGAGRHYHTYDYMDSSANSTEQLQRIGGNTSHAPTNRAASNSGPGGGGIASVASITRVQVTVEGMNVNMGQVNGGSWCLVPYVPLLLAQPSQAFDWPWGMWYWEMVVRWAVPPGNAAIDSGILISATDHARIATGSLQNDGIGIFNRGGGGGVLTFASRGAGGYEEVNIGAGLDLTKLNKIKLVTRSAVKSRPAQVEAWVNDQLMVTRQWVAGHKLITPATFTGSFVPQLVHAEAGTQFNYTQSQMVMGPDVANL